MKNTNQRRSWLKKSATLATGLYLGDYTAKAKSISVIKRRKQSAIVAGAGVMGCWTAYFLVKQGFEVTICDPYGVGNPRASSGGESRLIRYMYGEDELYFNMAKRSLELWVSEGKHIGKELFKNTGLLIFVENEKYEYAEQSHKLYEAAGLKLKRIPKAGLVKNYPFINSKDLSHAVYDPLAGYLLASESCKSLVNYLKFKGTRFIADSAQLGEIENENLTNVTLSDETTLEANHYVFANGPWMEESFPTLLKDKLRVNRQPVFFFGGPKGFAEKLKKSTAKNTFPVWMNRDANNQERCYGVYDIENNAFKIAYTQLEETIFDPTHGERNTTEKEINHARYLMEKRFPFMVNAPLLYTKICQHTDTPDKHFIVSSHPNANNLWLLGGGSGHAFKHGPALGEKMANAVVGIQTPEKRFNINRLKDMKKFSEKHK